MLGGIQCSECTVRQNSVQNAISGGTRYVIQHVYSNNKHQTVTQQNFIHIGFKNNDTYLDANTYIHSKNIYTHLSDDNSAHTC
jgi:hypothetical protein